MADILLSAAGLSSISFLWENSEAGNNLIMDKIHESGGGTGQDGSASPDDHGSNAPLAVLQAKKERRFKIKSLLFPISFDPITGLFQNSIG